jgi:3-deoxy-D-manno-octulosonic-acid transferase
MLIYPHSMSAFLTTYKVLLGLARTASPLVGPGSSKFAQGLAGRRSAHDKLARWGREQRDAARPTVWFHAPSVGEGLQALAVIEALRERDPSVQIAFTHFSPSAVRLASQMSVDVAGYLPWDLPGPIAQVLDAMSPDLIVFTKTEVWPVLVDEAGRRGIEVALVAGTVAEGSSRLRPVVRAFLAQSWHALKSACAVADADATRLRTLGVSKDALSVTGDPGIDSAAQRARAADPSAPFLAPFLADARPTLVAGSTWSADEDVLLPALLGVREQVPDLRLILAPHEPKTGHVNVTCRRLAVDGWSTATLSDIELSGSVEGVDAVVVDRVGALTELYTVGRVAYVGGGFHGAGLHSVLEPAAARLPILFGPRHHSASAAADLIAAGGARSIEGRNVMAEALLTWLTDDAKRDHAAQEAFGYIQAHLGAASRTAAALLKVLPSPSA